MRKGFSLIELLIVVAIIAILAAVAVPAYKNYMLKSRVSEALGILKNEKDKQLQYYAVNGSFNGDIIAPDVSSSTQNSLAGKDIVAISRSDGDSRKIWMRAHFRGATYLGGLSGKMIIMLLVNSDEDGDASKVKTYCGRWDSGDSTYADVKYLPEGCNESSVSDYE